MLNRKLVLGIASLALACTVVMWAQRRDPPAPTDKLAAWSAVEMQTIGKEMASTKEVTHRFFGEKGYNMEVRRLVGPQPILQHGKKSDFMVIQDGEGTFMSGGELVNGKPGGEDQGDMRGESIQNGVSRVLKPGDVVFVPAGLPHGFVETKDHVTFVMVRFDTK
jgi:mannose-6-phosphate isomerase-like protein (cupin superfamily)